MHSTLCDIWLNHNKCVEVLSGKIGQTNKNEMSQTVWTICQSDIWLALCLTTRKGLLVCNSVLCIGRFVWTACVCVCVPVCACAHAETSGAWVDRPFLSFCKIYWCIVMQIKAETNVTKCNQSCSLKETLPETKPGHTEDKLNAVTKSLLQFLP